MKIWAKDHKGVYKVFPHDLLKKLTDGSLGVRISNVKTYERVEPFLSEFIEKYDTGTDQAFYVLKSTIKRARK